MKTKTIRTVKIFFSFLLVVTTTFLFYVDFGKLSSNDSIELDAEIFPGNVTPRDVKLVTETFTGSVVDAKVDYYPIVAEPGIMSVSVSWENSYDIDCYMCTTESYLDYLVRGYTTNEPETCSYTIQNQGTYYIAIRMYTSYASSTSYTCEVSYYNNSVNPEPDEIDPVLTIDSPSEGENVENTVSISLTATDNIDTNLDLELNINSAGWFTTTNKYDWDTTAFLKEYIVILARATDDAGNIGSDSVTVYVNNSVEPNPEEDGNTNFLGAVAGHEVEYYDIYAYSGEISVSVSWDNSYDIDVYICESEDYTNYLARGYTTNMPETCSYTISSTGTYFIAIRMYSSSASSTDYDCHVIWIADDSNSGNITGPSHEIYFSYSNFETYMQTIGTDFPEITQVYSVNDQYNVATSTYGGREVWGIEISDESSTLEKAEILLVGAHHGDEKISVENALITIENLINGWINEDDYICFLLKTRKIVIIPMMNPDGYAANRRTNDRGVDLNRNYDYDNAGGNSFTQVETKCIREIVAAHRFVSTITWHSGTHGMFYPWGSLNHETSGVDACPDDSAYHDMAALMSQEGGTYREGYYEYGILNDDLYGVNGGYEDWVYGAESEPEYTEFGPYMGASSLVYCVEASSTKTPSTSYVPGYTAKNWEMAKKVAIDSFQPYGRFIDSTTTVSSGELFALDWNIGGCFDVDMTQIAYSDSFAGVTAESTTGNSWYGVTPTQTGSSFWYQSNDFTVSLQAPTTPGTNHFTIRLKADADYSPNGAYSYWAQDRDNNLYFSVVREIIVS